MTAREATICSATFDGKDILVSMETLKKCSNFVNNYSTTAEKKLVLIIFGYKWGRMEIHLRLEVKALCERTCHELNR